MAELQVKKTRVIIKQCCVVRQVNPECLMWVLGGFFLLLMMPVTLNDHRGCNWLKGRVEEPLHQNFANVTLIESFWK